MCIDVYRLSKYIFAIVCVVLFLYALLTKKKKTFFRLLFLCLLLTVIYLRIKYKAEISLPYNFDHPTIYEVIKIKQQRGKRKTVTQTTSGRSPFTFKYINFTQFQNNRTGNVETFLVILFDRSKTPRWQHRGQLKSWF